VSDPTPREPRPAAAAQAARWDEGPRETVVAVFGDAARSGAWLPPERLHAVAGFGNVRLDFREADLPPGPTEIRAFAVFGNVELFVPRGLDVELGGVSLFGSIRHRSDRKVGRKILDRVLGEPPAADPRPDDDEDRWLVVQGWAVFGNVKVTVVD